MDKEIYFLILDNCPGAVATGSPYLYFSSNVSPRAIASGSPIGYLKKGKKKSKFAPVKILK